MSASFEGRVGIVTGAASGIGRAIAEAFHRRGARVAIYDVTGADAAAAEIGAGALAIDGDVTDPHFEDETMRRILVGNTPQGRSGPVADVVGPVLFLCSDDALHVHGATLSVNGGWVAAKGY